MNKQSEGSLSVINFIISAYFLWAYMFYQLNVSSGFVQFLMEILTIPMMIAQLVFLVLGIIFIFRFNTGIWMKISLAALLISAILTIGSFFW